MARFEIVVGDVALSSSLAAGSTLVQLELIGGFETFASASLNSGREVFDVPPVDNKRYRLTWET